MVAADDDDTAPDAADRRIVDLQGGSNFRDVGGYETAAGGTVRWGLVYRSAALHRLTEADVATLEGLGLRVVYDLRADQERQRSPSILPADIATELLPIGGAAAKTQELTDLLAEGRLAELPTDFLERIYDSMADAAAPAFGRLLTALAEPGGTPALIHCTAGKDRTGMCVALLLSALGVGESDILDDYELSAIHFTRAIMERLQRRDESIDVERYRAVLGAPRKAMASLLASLRDRYGSVEGYLVQEAGLTPEIFRMLQQQLVEPQAVSAITAGTH